MMQTEENSNESQLEAIFAIKDLTILNSETLYKELAAFINKLLLTNFERLVQLLYRIDVSEMRLKSLLKDNPKEDAGNIIASLIIERQAQKIISKQQFKNDEEKFCNEERW